MQQEPLSSEISPIQTLSTPAAAQGEVKATAVAASSEYSQEEKQIKSAIAGLWPYSPIREPASRALQGQKPVTLYPMLDALRQPFSLNWRDAQVAAWILAYAPLWPEQKVEALNALTGALWLSVSRSPLNKLSRTKWAITATVFMSLIFAMFAAMMFSEDVTELWRLTGIIIQTTVVCNVILACVLVPLPYLLDCLHENRRWRVRASVVKAIGRLSGAESVDLFAAALEDPASAVRDEAMRVLLPRLTPAHRGQLRPHVITALCSDIEYKSEDEVLQRMDALEMVGDSQALKTMKHMQHYGRTGHIRHRAAEVFAVLEARRAQEHAPKMLLRASDAGRVSADMLLRAASENSLADPAQLLRASMSVTEEDQKA